MKRLVALAVGCPVTIVLSSMALLLMAVPIWHHAWQLERTAVLSGEWLRLLSGHFVHWNNEHLFWDLLMFVCLGVVCERRDRIATAGLIIVAAMTISAGFLWFQPDLAVYRGLSGIDSALFAMMLLLVGHDYFREGDRLMTGVVAGLGCGFIGKTCYEYVTGATLFVDSIEAGFTPLPLSHLIGAACGILAAIGSLVTPRWRLSAGASCSRPAIFHAP